MTKYLQRRNARVIWLDVILFSRERISPLHTQEIFKFLTSSPISLHNQNSDKYANQLFAGNQIIPEGATITFK
jgi:hypothetical protein